MRDFPYNNSKPVGSIRHLEKRKIFVYLLIRWWVQKVVRKFWNDWHLRNDSIKKTNKQTKIHLPKDTTQPKLLKMQQVWVPFDHVILHGNVWRILSKNKALNKVPVYSNIHVIFFQYFWYEIFSSNVPLHSFKYHIFF